MIIDTHMHIYDKKYNNEQLQVIEQSLALGVTKMIAVGCDYKTSLAAIKLANEYDFIYAAIGLHPSDSKYETDLSLSWIEDLLKQSNKIIAIGEIGLDYYWDKDNKDSQKEFFIKQIVLAKKHNLPIIVHSRDSISDCYEILKNNPIKGVMHCFSSSVEMAKEFVKLGMYIGVGGVVTFKNSKEIKEVVKTIDMNYILSETDSPYLTPEPYRGKLNIPGYTKYVVDAIAALKELSKETVINTIEQNVKDLFKI